MAIFEHNTDVEAEAKQKRLTDEESKFVDSMRSSSDEYMPYTRGEVDQLIAVIDRLLERKD